MNVYIKSEINNASNFLELAPIVKNAKEYISFFGGRYIYAEGYRGTADINAIAARFMFLQRDDLELDDEERKIGKELIPLISKLYESNYSRRRNILTRIFCAIRDFFRNVCIFFSNQGYGTRGTWSINDGDKEDFFDTYSYSQYKKLFGEPPQGVLCGPRWYPPGYFK